MTYIARIPDMSMIAPGRLSRLVVPHVPRHVTYGIHTSVRSDANALGPLSPPLGGER